MTEQVHHDATSAWQHLCELGGIELKGRDEGLDQRIHNRLNPAATSFEIALAQSTMEAFTEAFFASMHPYVDMFRDILDFFENADATQGESQWSLQVDDTNLDLEHFRKWLAAWDNIAKSDINVPAIDSKAIRDLWGKLLEQESLSGEIRRSFNNEPLKLSDDVRAWVSAYNEDNYLPLPNSLLPPNCPEELQDCTSIARVAIQRLLDLNLTRSSLKDLYDNRIAGDPSDGLEFRTILQNETDLWLRTFVVGLSAATSLNSSELALLGEDLDEIISKFPTRPFQVDVSIGDLESVISLPVWKKRYDLYSVWIATEIIRSLDGHDVEIHHEKGKIAFAFKETLVATIRSSPGPFRLVSERRVPLENPIGSSRKHGVQPDHGLWTTENSKEVCKLVVEVKHYKNPAKTRFKHVFEDYAHANPESDVYLVNHGPAGNAVYEVSRDVSRRCFAIGHLTSSNHEARQELAHAVQECVGDPLVRWPTKSETSSGSSVLLFDVSGSMKLIMQSEEMHAFVRNLAASELPAKLVAADTTIIETWDTSESSFTGLLRSSGRSTDLGGPVLELLNQYESVLVVTDDDGLSTLRDVDIALRDYGENAPAGITIRVCTRTEESS